MKKTTEIKKNLSLIKKLIIKIIDYNLKNGTHIFIRYAPHCKMVEFDMYNSEDRKWFPFAKMITETIYYDNPTDEVAAGIQKIEEWLI